MEPDTTHDADRQLGDYRLKTRISGDAQKTTWLAEQLSVGRVVIVDELVDHGAEAHRIFLADTRARAAVDHPLIASVYEAVDLEGCCLRASERLCGETLQSMADAGQVVDPARMAAIVRSIAEANLHHQSHRRSTQPMGLAHVHVDPDGTTRMANLAKAGEREAGESARDVRCIGRDLSPLVATHRPGSTRLQTLLAWMRGRDRPAPLEWTEVIDLCKEIDRQLSMPTAQALADGRRAARDVEKRGVWLLSMLTVAGLLAIAGIAWLVRPQEPEPAKHVPLPAVEIPAGDYPSPQGGVVSLPAFRIDASEVTIRDYREFVETLAVLAADGREDAFDHPDQPPSKRGHTPENWDDLLLAARGRNAWNGMPVSLDSPVAGVDFWDAHAYATWRKARLPTQEEWYAAVHHQTGHPEQIPTSPWRPFLDVRCDDRTGAGVFGVAGSLSEWTRSLATSPSNPLGSPQHVIVGGSYLRPSRNALGREWTADPSLRRADLGFRLIRSGPGEE